MEEIQKRLEELNQEKIIAYKEVERIRLIEMDLLKELETLKTPKD